MSDLISRQALKSDILADNVFDGDTKKYLINMIDGYDAAYDVEKVVEDLKEYDFNSKPITAFGQELQKRCINKAISIVKGAIKDETDTTI